MKNNLGYTKELIILPFDHRSSFTHKLFGIKGKMLTEEQTQRVKDAKHIIYQAFKKSVAESVPKENGAILIDEQFGAEIIDDANQNGYTVILTTEKSGQEIFDFEYGQEFQKHLEKFKPTFAKALVRYNPQHKEENKVQLEHLKTLSDYCHQNGYKLLIEPLIPATNEQLQTVENDEKRYDLELRPKLELEMIRELQEAGVEPDIWKLEGMEKKQDYEAAVRQARSGGRNEVGIIILGRAADDQQVTRWLTTGAKVPGVIGFAIGRTIFWDALVSWKDGALSAEQAADKISNNFQKFYKIFKEAQAKI